MLVTVTVYCTVLPTTAELTFAVLTITSGPAAITRVTALVAVLLLASVTATVKE